MECFSVFVGGCIKSSPGRQNANTAYLSVCEANYLLGSQASNIEIHWNVGSRWFRLSLT